MSTRKLSQFGAEKFIQELLKSKEAKPLEDFDNAWDIKSNFLTEKANDIMNRRYFGNPDKLITYSQLSAEFNITTERVRQIVQKSLRILRNPHKIILFTVGVNAIEIKNGSYYKDRILHGENPEIVYDESIEVLRLSTRSYDCLARANILTLYQLSQMNIERLMKIRNFGKNSLNELILKCEEFGIVLN